jgi:LacI family transcriptional regulator/LacI family repressor for deo operon, udp, cdd, tsx, nupC, and nupG
LTYVFCCNDMVAIGALMACRTHGVGVPQPLSVIGFDDIDMARNLSPPLTTTNQPKSSLGRTAMRMLLNVLDARPIQNHVLVPTLIQRASTARR